MSDKIINLIYDISKNYTDPITKLPLDKNNKNLSITENNGNVNLSLEINPKNQNDYNEILKKLEAEIKKTEGILSVNIIITAQKELNKNENKTRFKINSKNIIAIASGKGGVGKSTFAVNFAVALNKTGKKVGLLDADIYGPSIPRMMGIDKKPERNSENKLIPLEKYNIRCMSIGFLIDVDTPTIWRGPMVMKALEQMFNHVEWGELDYLIIDLPPGTGDAQLSLAQHSKLSGSIIISTPQDIALIDARKGINMFNKVNVPIIGLVENMSFFKCDNCNEKHFIFSNGGVEKEAKKSNIKFLGSLPLDKNLRIKSDEGRPVCIDEGNNDMSEIYLSIANQINESFIN